MWSQEQISGALDEVRERLPDSVELIAVTKRHPPEMFSILKNLGVHHIGENRGQELRDKFSSVPDLDKNFLIHFIAPLQLNKIKYIAGKVFSFDALDHLEVAEALNERYEREDLGTLRTLIQINSSGEEQKSGWSLEDESGLMTFFEKAEPLSHIEVEGLMTMGATPSEGYGMDNPAYVDELRKSFARTRKLLEKLRERTGFALPRLSMGMSADWPIAVEEGATEIRLGSVLFGPRE